ncbi:MAG: divalent-cation tolerance protein CutA [Candidatus Binatia bacterium]
MSRNENTKGAVLVLTTTADDDSALALSRQLVEEGLAACVSRTAVKSVFRWEPAPTAQADRREKLSEKLSGMNICEENEVQLVIKTSRARAAALESRLLDLHPYDCPELIRIEPEHVDEKYLAWLLVACE